MSKSDIFKKVLSDYKTGTAQGINTDLFNIYKDNYHKAIAGVFGELKQGDKYFAIAEEFKLNMARMAAYKSAYASELLSKVALQPGTFTEKGNKILKMFNRWQATEYNTAISRARTAKQFMQFKERSNVFPNLEWLPSRSVHVREEHVKFYGLVLPINDPFWQTNQPGNLYNCKCDWQQTDKPASDTAPKSVRPHAGLDGNPASTGEIYTQKHPYYTKVKNSKSTENFLIQMFLKTQRVNVFEWAKKQLIDVKIENVDKVGTVTFSNKGLKEAINQPHEFPLDKNVAIYSIEKRIKSAKYVKTVEDFKNRKNNIYHYFETKIRGKLSFIIVKETKHDNTKRFYNIVDKIKESD